MRQIYVASFSYGKANLTRVEVVKETPKSFMVKSRESKIILGWQYLPERVSKEKHHYFDTPEQAMEHLVKCGHEHILACRKKLEQAISEHHKLIQLRDSCLAGAAATDDEEAD